MSEYGPSLPTGYDTAKRIPTERNDCFVTVGFDQAHRELPRFLVQLRYVVRRDPVVWASIARMDHNELTETGHDVYRDGLHVDIDRRTAPEVTRRFPHPPLPRSHGRLLRECQRYLTQNADWFVDVYECRQAPDEPPSWSPDGGPPPELLSAEAEVSGVNGQHPREKATVTPEELSELLADATGEPVAAIEAGVTDYEIPPPWNGEPVDE